MTTELEPENQRDRLRRKLDTEYHNLAVKLGERYKNNKPGPADPKIILRMAEILKEEVCLGVRCPGCTDRISSDNTLCSCEYAAMMKEIRSLERK
jgi:hypothetical protein